MISLQVIRKRVGWSQVEMAKYLQITKSHVSMHESGKRPLARRAQEKLTLLELEQDRLSKKDPAPVSEQNRNKRN